MARPDKARTAAALAERLLAPVRYAEELGIDYLLVAQRWWGSGEETEHSTYDCLAMTAFYAAHTTRIRLITAVHPGFFAPAAIAKWGATIDQISGGRWAINVTSGWHEVEFGMYGAALLEHDDRYARSREFIEVLRGAWTSERFSYEGKFYQVRDLIADPRPRSPRLEVFQGGQSPAAIALAASHSDWMFLNGGPPERIRRIIAQVRARTAATGRRVRFALYAIPLCRDTDSQAQEEIEMMLSKLPPELHERRKLAHSGAQGMWSANADKLAMLDTNEGYSSGLIGSPQTILSRMAEFHSLGIDCFHLALIDTRFNREVLPRLASLSRTEPPPV
ncbi:MAG: LLM class flavin-dependent oxidoreductase [Candidatus Binataceae bacterium]